MKVSLQQISKRFGAQKVLQQADLILESGSITGITGPNGSGKSTLLQIIAGALKADEGSIAYESDGLTIADDQIFRHVSIAAPYLNLYEDLELDIALNTHCRFKALRPGISASDLFSMVLLADAKHKKIRDLSSGMRQRFKLGLAVLSDTSLLLLDEPGSNLDAAGIIWYQDLLQEHSSNRTVVVCSNREEEELKLCNRIVALTEL